MRKPVTAAVAATRAALPAGSRDRRSVELVCLALALALLALVVPDRQYLVTARRPFPDCSSLTARLGRCSDLASATRAASVP